MRLTSKNIPKILAQMRTVQDLKTALIQLHILKVHYKQNIFLYEDVYNAFIDKTSFRFTELLENNNNIFSTKTCPIYDYINICQKSVRSSSIFKCTSCENCIFRIAFSSTRRYSLGFYMYIFITSIVDVETVERWILEAIKLKTKPVKPKFNIFNIMKKLKLFMLMLSIAVLTSCATIMHGSKQSVTFNSDPPGQAIVINGMDIGDTPMSIKLERNKDHVVKIGEEKTVLINSSVSPWILGNILYGGVLGIVIDAVTGAMYKLSPDNISVSVDN